jgi:Raf kinase inhibitor-like YbhB/YbcL family protein
MNINSQAFGYKQFIPQKYTCEGSNVSPPLMFSGMPGNTASLALIMDDPDASSGTYTHWIVYNMTRDTTSIPEGGLPPSGMQGSNSAGRTRYDGPCPPSGIHRYIFHLYALDRPLEIQPGASRQTLEGAMHGNILEKAEHTGLYQKAVK